MKRLFLPFFIVFSLTAFGQLPKYVVLIGVDGMGGYAFPKAKTPNMNALMSEGAYTFTAKCVMPSSSSQNWASMVMGARPGKTHVKRNGFSMKYATNKSFCGRPEGRLFPSIYTILREQKTYAKIVVLHHWDDYARLVEDKDLTLRKHTKTEDSTAIAAVEVIKKDMPDLLFMHFDHVDHAGHAIGHNTPQYFMAVAKADSLIGLVIAALKAKNIYDETAIIVTADHGGRGKGHGGPSKAERNIPWIIKAPGVKPNTALTGTVHQYDTAATLAYLLNLTPPSCWQGKPVMEAFEKK